MLFGLLCAPSLGCCASKADLKLTTDDLLTHARTGRQITTFPEFA